MKFNRDFINAMDGTGRLLLAFNNVSVKNCVRVYMLYDMMNVQYMYHMYHWCSCPSRDLGAVSLYCLVDCLGFRGHRLPTPSPCQLSALLSQTTKLVTKIYGACHQLQTRGMQEVKELFAPR